MSTAIQVRIFARDCQNDAQVREFLAIGTYLSAHVRSLVDIQATCTECTECTLPGPHRVEVDGVNLGPVNLWMLVDYLHFCAMGVIAA